MNKKLKVLFSIVSSLVIAPMAMTACSPVESASPALTLDFPAGFSTSSSISLSGVFDETDSFVVRCTSFAESDSGITLTASKAKDARVGALVFINSREATGSNSSVRVACAPITGKEYEYDMMQAKYYEISSASAVDAIAAYGIYYSDWQTGAVNNSEKFPCCE